MSRKHSRIALACALVAMSAAANADTALTLEAVRGGQGIPIALLDDGRMADGYENDTYPDPATCSQGTHDLPGSCAYPSSFFTGIELSAPGQSTDKLSPNLWGRQYVIQSTGRIIHWSLGQSDYQVYDIAADMAAPLPQTTPPPAEVTAQCISSGSVPFWRAVSPQGMLVGQLPNTCPTSTALYLWSGTASTTIGAPRGYSFLQFSGINASNQVAFTGTSTSALGTGGAFLWTPGKTSQALAAPFLTLLQGYSRTVARSLNDSGDVVGYAYKKSNSMEMRAMLWRGGVATDIGAKSGYKYSYAVGVTNNGLVIGCGNNEGFASAPGHYFLWENGKSRAWTPAATADGTAVPAMDCWTTSAPGSTFLSNKASQWLITVPSSMSGTSSAVYRVSPQN